MDRLQLSLIYRVVRYVYVYSSSECGQLLFLGAMPGVLKNEVNDGEDGLIFPKAPLEQAYFIYVHQVAGRRRLGIIPAPTLGAKLSTRSTTHTHTSEKERAAYVVHTGD